MGEETENPERDASGRFTPKGEEAEQGQGVDHGDVPEERVVKEGSGEAPTDESPMERVERLARGDLKEGEGGEDISGTVAPSVGPEGGRLPPPVERAGPGRRPRPMGKRKARPGGGNLYGPSFARQATLYGIFVAVIVALFIGGKIV